ncbi:MAG TPA: EamA family transporter [Blastocatellia bacterium]|nr:EamA family transporter [Blastocatellia bacterium]
MKAPLIVWLVLCLIWGSTWLFIKLGLRELPPFTFAGLRFLLASAILWAIVIVWRRPLPKSGRDWLKLAWVGFIAIAVNFGLIFWGEQHINSGLAAVLQATIPAFGLVFAHYHLPNERLTARKLGGVAVGVAGVSLIFYDQLKIEGAAALQGSLALLLSSVCVAYSNVFIKARLQHIDSSVIAAGQMVWGVFPLLALAAALEGNPFDHRWSTQSLLAVSYLALIGTVLGFLLYFWLVTKIEVTKTMLISLVIPVTALLIGKLKLDERLSWSIVAGSAAILAGIWLIVFHRRAR